VANTLSRALLGPAFFCARDRIAAKAGVVAGFFISKLFISKLLFLSPSFPTPSLPNGAQHARRFLPKCRRLFHTTVIA
jgi:hypothetical protein